MSLAVANYHADHGQYPPPFVNGPDGRPWHSWRVLLLPYISDPELHQEYNFAEPWDGPNNSKLAERMPRLYRFHSSSKKPSNTTTNYLAVVGPETIWRGTPPVKEIDVTDGVAQTILIVENNGAGVHWMEPRDLTLADMEWKLNHPQGISSPYDRPAVATADGTLHRLLPELPPATLRALLTFRAGDFLQPDEAGGWEPLQDGRARPLQQP
ncbi:MAG: DUF1559 domain-containing protein [Gemmataceae bacterium]